LGMYSELGCSRRTNVRTFSYGRGSKAGRRHVRWVRMRWPCIGAEAARCASRRVPSKARRGLANRPDCKAVLVQEPWRRSGATASRDGAPRAPRPHGGTHQRRLGGSPLLAHARSVELADRVGRGDEAGVGGPLRGLQIKLRLALRAPLCHGRPAGARRRPRGEDGESPAPRAACGR
jgi:hypothetical protein